MVAVQRSWLVPCQGSCDMCTSCKSLSPFFNPPMPHTAVAGMQYHGTIDGEAVEPNANTRLVPVIDGADLDVYY